MGDRSKFSIVKCLAGIIAAVSLLGGCAYLDSHDMLGLLWTRSGDVDARFDESLAIHRNAVYVLDNQNNCVIAVPERQYSVYICADSHINGPNPNVERFVKDLTADGDAAFALHLGDIIDAHAKDNFDDARKLFGPAWDRMFFACGNHDIMFGQWDRFKDSLGSAAYSFEVVMPDGTRDFYLCLDSSSGTLGRRQTEWAENRLKAAKDCRHRIVFTHTHFFHRDGSTGIASHFPLEETYALVRMFEDNAVDVVLSGHDHYREDTIFHGVRFEIFDALVSSQPTPYYSIMTVGDKAVTFEYISTK